MALENEPNSPQQELKPENKKIYRLESGAVVELEWEVTNPTKEQEGQPKKTVIFLPGWGMQAEDTSNDGLQKAFSLNRQTYTITSSSKYKNYDLKQDGNEKPDLLNEEAKAIAQFIKEHGITNVTIAGHSRGGSKAINLTKILQGDPELDINGLILMGAVGLYVSSSVSTASEEARGSRNKPFVVSFDLSTHL